MQVQKEQERKAVAQSKGKKSIPAYGSRTRWVSPAPVLDIPRPDVRLVRSDPVGNGRRVWLVLSPFVLPHVATKLALHTVLVGILATAFAIWAMSNDERFYQRWQRGARLIPNR